MTILNITFSTTLVISVVHEAFIAEELIPFKQFYKKSLFLYKDPKLLLICKTYVDLAIWLTIRIMEHKEDEKLKKCKKKKYLK